MEEREACCAGRLFVRMEMEVIPREEKVELEEMGSLAWMGLMWEELVRRRRFWAQGMLQTGESGKGNVLGN